MSAVRVAAHGTSDKTSSGTVPLVLAPSVHLDRPSLRHALIPTDAVAAAEQRFAAAEQRSVQMPQSAQQEPTW